MLAKSVIREWSLFLLLAQSGFATFVLTISNNIVIFIFKFFALTPLILPELFKALTELLVRTLHCFSLTSCLQHLRKHAALSLSQLTRAALLNKLTGR